MNHLIEGHLEAPTQNSNSSFAQPWNICRFSILSWIEEQSVLFLILNFNQRQIRFNFHFGRDSHDDDNDDQCNDAKLAFKITEVFNLFRFLNAREFMHLMGLPHDFEIGNVTQLNHIAQNVSQSYQPKWKSVISTT